MNAASVFAVALLLAVSGAAPVSAAPASDAALAQEESFHAEIARTGQWNGHMIRGPWDIDDKILGQPEPSACHRDLSSVTAPLFDLTPDIHDRFERVNRVTGHPAGETDYIMALTWFPELAWLADRAQAGDHATIAQIPGLQALPEAARIAATARAAALAPLADLAPGIYLKPGLGPHTLAHTLHHERCHWLTKWVHGEGAPRGLDGKILP